MGVHHPDGTAAEDGQTHGVHGEPEEVDVIEHAGKGNGPLLFDIVL